jgi:hypothetical protein
MPSPLRERRGGWRRGILKDVGCMGMSCAAIFMYKLDKNNVYAPGMKENSNEHNELTPPEFVLVR